MNGINSKTKTILLLAGFVVFAALMFFFGYDFMAGRNQLTADAVAAKRVELEVLDREQKSFEQGKKDLAILEASEYPPEELFSSDTKVVKEIQLLEEAAARYSLELNIAVTGNAKSAVKVPGTGSELYAIPYTITLEGIFANVLLFMQNQERMPFIAHAKDVSVTVSTEDKTRTVITSEFYIKK